ncbi:hypothetical protein [Tenacibaculum jejuense]|uniref:Uncharacterized protein n=1 Tax=Tenacibaculum jejuense TaxID=584609 RepID=A0A238UBX0_9FLAO|nr:hypothetical protein [Tenacibaculum jejuense]SNR16068.1 protein of unknown function [Tenacibaculum jejuense]
MIINQPFTITNSVTVSDGGTKYIIGNDKNDNKFTICIYQFVFKENFNSKRIPGRLYFNDLLIDIRSDIEKNIVEALEKCIVKSDLTEISFSSSLSKIKDVTNLAEANDIGPGFADSYLIKLILDYIKSDLYIKNSEKFK